MSNLTQQVSKALQDEWPKALIGLIVPAGQYCWKFWSDHRVENRKRVLRERIASLDDLRHVQFGSNPEEAKVKQDAEDDYAAAVRELSEICHPQTQPVLASSDPHQPVPLVRGQRSIRRWLLLYAPKRAIAWIPHTLYFIALTITVLVLIGLAGSLSDGSLDSDALWGLLFAIALWIAITPLFRVWAVRANGNVVPAAEPSRFSRRWVATLIVATALFLEVFFVIGSALDDNEELSYDAFQRNIGQILGGSAFFLAVALVGWIWRRRIGRRLNSGAQRQAH